MYLACFRLLLREIFEDRELCTVVGVYPLRMINYDFLSTDVNFPPLQEEIKSVDQNLHNLLTRFNKNRSKGMKLISALLELITCTKT
jgi:hypothetical protein